MIMSGDYETLYDEKSGCMLVTLKEMYDGVRLKLILRRNLMGIIIR